MEWENQFIKGLKGGRMPLPDELEHKIWYDNIEKETTMKEIFKLLKELDELTGHIWRLEICTDESGCFYDTEDSNEYNGVYFESLEECQNLMYEQAAKIKAENKKANTATYSMPELKEVQKLIDKLSEDIGRILKA